MSLLSLINWRREIFNIYNEVRSEEDGIIAWNKWKDKREKLFKFHPESPTFNRKNSQGSMKSQFYIHTMKNFLYFQNLN